MAGKKFFPGIAIPGCQAYIQRSASGSARTLYPNKAFRGGTLMPAKAAKIHLAVSKIVLCGQRELNDIFQAFYIFIDGVGWLFSGLYGQNVIKLVY